jgi:RNA polymerase sigma factor (sigma-70 family)
VGSRSGHHDPDKPPQVGPFGTLEWVADAGRWRYGLNAEGDARLTAWLSDWPKPGKLLATAFPGAFRFARKAGLDLDEINAVCRQACVKAMAKYDPERANGATFSAYAGWWMRQAVQREAQERAKLWLRAGVKVLEGDRPVGFDDVAGLLSLTPARRDPSLDPVRRERAERLKQGVAGVLRRRVASVRYREVFALRYGLHDGEAMTLEEVGEVFGISRERVRQIEVKVMAKVRDDLEGLYLDHCR